MGLLCMTNTGMLDLSVSSQRDLDFSPFTAETKPPHIPLEDNPFPGTRLPPLRSPLASHSQSRGPNTYVDSVVYDSQTNLFGSQCTFALPSHVTPQPKPRIYSYNIDAIEQYTAHPQITDYACSLDIYQYLSIGQSQILPLPPQFLVDVPHHRLVSGVPQAYSVLLSEGGQAHPQNNLIRIPATAVNAMELSAIHVSHLAAHQQRINNLILENVSQTHTELDELK